MIDKDSGIIHGPDGVARCWWCHGHADYVQYHDCEWGVPVDDDRRLFEKICLEGFQSGLSWLTVLRKRSAFREVFFDFDFHRIARFTQRDIRRLLKDERIIRHRGKIEATVNNARHAISMQRQFGSLAAWFWQFEPVDADSRPLLTNRQQALQRTTCPEAISMARQLKQHGWAFVGPTTAYAFMQSMGLVNDHLVTCKRHPIVQHLRQNFSRPRPTAPSPPN